MNELEIDLNHMSSEGRSRNYHMYFYLENILKRNFYKERMGQRQDGHDTPPFKEGLLWDRLHPTYIREEDIMILREVLLKFFRS